MLGAGVALDGVDGLAATVRRLLDRILALTPADAGRFIGPDGNDLPW